MIQEAFAPTRRRMLLLAAMSAFEPRLRLHAGDAEFWNRKDPSEWSADEIDRLITKSPWAKEISAQAPQSGHGGLSVPGIGRGGLGGGRRQRQDAGSHAAPFKGVVRWESAKPVIEAMKTPLPGEFANHYVISVSGIRHADSIRDESHAAQRESEAALDKIKNLTYLEPKGTASAQPGIVQETAFGVGETRTMLFGFSKDLLQLSLDDKEVSFTTQMGTIQVKAKFSFKEMVYHKELAV
jgi:hypothetical protein